MTENTADRRRFYRIKDRVSLNYCVVQSAGIDQEINKTNRRQQELAELRNATHAIDARLEAINIKLSRENPLIAETLDLFHRKIALHERMFRIDDDDDGKVFSQAREISLSASGVAFDAETPLNQGTHLKLELIIYPENHYIPVFAHVVKCKQIQDDSSAGYHIAVEFEGISNENEERIINHIFKIQAQEIKREKETRQQDNKDDQVSTG